MNPLVILGGVVAVGAALALKGNNAMASDSIEPQVLNDWRLNSDDWTRFDYLFRRYGQSYDVPWKWLKATALQESSLGKRRSVRKGLENPTDVDGSISDDGLSWGLMQVTLDTAADFRPGTTAVELNDPEISIELAAKILRRNMNKFPDSREYAIRAYNGGLGFQHTKRGITDTPKYYAEWLDKLQSVLDRQPGNELERG